MTYFHSKAFSDLSNSLKGPGFKFAKPLSLAPTTGAISMTDMKI